MSTSSKVTRWAEIIETAIEDVGAVRLELGTMLALVATESSGNPDVVNRFGFVGLFQIGTPYLKDARRWLKKHRPELLREVPRTKHGLTGNARASALVTAAYMRLYSPRHEWDPSRIAAIHKGGAGAARKVMELEAEGKTTREAVQWVANHWRYSKGRRKGRLILGDSFYAYVYDSKHFGGHRPDYDAWAAEWRAQRSEVFVDAEQEPAATPVQPPAVVWGRYIKSVWSAFTGGSSE